jgi:uncharacterized protein YjbI with pentapeptide repeats
MIPHPNFPQHNINYIFSQLEIDEIIEKHTLWLQDDPLGERAYLAYANFDGLDFSNKSLLNLGFEKSSFIGCNFEGVFTNHCSFRNANFTGAEVTNARLDICNFLNSDFTDASLTGTSIASFGNNREIKNINITKYLFTYTATHIGLDCMWFEIDWWKNATLEEVQALAPGDEDMELMYFLLQNAGLPIVEISPATPYRV